MKIALLGLGWISQLAYLPFLEENRHVHAVIGYDASTDVRASLEGRYGKVEIAGDPHRLFAPDVDLVVIATPSYLHCEQILAAAEQGRSVLCEKPICISVEEARLVETAFRGRPQFLLTSVPSRYRDEMIFLKSLLDSGRLGTLYHVRFSWMKRSGIPGGRWFTDRSKSGGGVLADMGPHALDLVWWLAGVTTPPTEMLGAASAHFSTDASAYASWHTGATGQPAADVEDNLYCLLGDSRMSCALELAWASRIAADDVALEGWGTEGSFSLSTALGFSTNVRNRMARLRVTFGSGEELFEFPLPERTLPFRRMLDDYLDRIAAGRVDVAELPRAAAVASTISAIYDRTFLVSGNREQHAAPRGGHRFASGGRIG